MPQIIYYDPVTFEWIPDLSTYRVEIYNPPAQFLVSKQGEEGGNLVDIEDYGGNGSCTCQNFAYRKDPNNQRTYLEDLNPQKPFKFPAKPKGESHTCKHIRLVKYLLRHLDTAPNNREF